MAWDRIEGDWKLPVGKVKEKWGTLTDDDIAALTASVSVRRQDPRALRAMKRCR